MDESRIHWHLTGRPPESRFAFSSLQWTGLTGLLDRFLPTGRTPENQRWTLVGIGRSTVADQGTRGNLAVEMLIRWAVTHGRLVPPVVSFPAGGLYDATPRIQVFLPNLPTSRILDVYQTVLDAGIQKQRIILLSTDLRLPFGYGRLRLSGEGSHPAVREILRFIGGGPQARLVLGLSPIGNLPKTFLAEKWPEEQWNQLDALEAPFNRFVDLLEETQQLSALAAQVNELAFWPGPKNL